MISLSFFLISRLFAVASAWQYVFTDSESDVCHEPCFTTDVGAFQTVRTPIWFSQSPRDSFERSKLGAVNGSAWEQWYFETVSESSQGAFVMAFSRDPSYKGLGYGVLRVELIFAWENGTRTTMTEFAEQSRVQDCCGSVRGRWSTQESVYQFDVSADLQTATITLDTPSVSGTVTLKSFGPARYPDGAQWPSRTASTELCPGLHFTEAMTAAHADIDLIVQGSKLSFKGLGGHNHVWAPFDWFTIVLGWDLLRGTAGPYAFTLWNPISKLDGGATYQSAMLLENGKPIFTAALRESHTTSESKMDHVLLRRSYGGNVTTPFGDASSGWEISFVSPSSAARWDFTASHQSQIFEVALGDGKGLVGFTDSIVGGRVDGEQFSGYAIYEQVELPPKMGFAVMFRVWWSHKDLLKTSILGSLWRSILGMLY